MSASSDIPACFYVTNDKDIIYSMVFLECGQRRNFYTKSHFRVHCQVKNEKHLPFQYFVSGAINSSGDIILMTIWFHHYCCRY